MEFNQRHSRCQRIFLIKKKRKYWKFYYGDEKYSSIESIGNNYDQRRKDGNE